MNKHKKRMAKWRRRHRVAGSAPSARAAAPEPRSSAGQEPPDGGEDGGTPGRMAEGAGVADPADRMDRTDRRAGAAGTGGGAGVAGMANGAGAGDAGVARSARSGAGGEGAEPETRRGPKGKFSVELLLRVAQRVRGGENVGEAIVAEGMSRAQFYARVAREPKLGEWLRWTRLARPLEALEEELLERAVYGVPRPIFRGGEQVGEWRVRSDSLLIWMLEQYVPEKYGPRDEEGHPPPPLDMPDPLAAARSKVIGDMVVEEAFRRALEGVERPVFHRGEQVGTVRAPSDRLLKYLYAAERRAVAEAARTATDGAGSAGGNGVEGEPADRTDSTDRPAERLGDRPAERRVGAPVQAGAGASTEAAPEAAPEGAHLAGNAPGAGVGDGAEPERGAGAEQGGEEGRGEPADTRPAEIPDNGSAIDTQDTRNEVDTCANTSCSGARLPSGAGGLTGVTKASAVPPPALGGGAMG